MISLRKTKDIKKVFKDGPGFRDGNFFLKAAKNSLETSRFAFVAGLKVSKKASQRNRVKRRIREIVRDRLSTISPGFDVVIIALAGAGNNDFQATETAINKLLRLSGLTRQ